MPVLHMQTEQVRTTGNQLLQTSRSLQQQTQALNNSVNMLAGQWLGSSRDIFLSEMEALLRQLVQLAEVGSDLNLRLQREVDEWEQTDSSFGNSSMTTAPGAAPDQTDWFMKELFTNLYISEKTSLGSDGSLIDAASQLMFFYENVRTGGDWDYKNNLLQKFNESGIVLSGDVYANDVPGNIMYGFMGASLADEIELATLGLNAEDVLLGLAGYVQVNPNATQSDIAGLLLNLDRERLLVYSQALDDPLDRNAILVGMELYRQGPSQENLERLLESTELRRP
ncbi:MAG: polymorphic toxin type 44 domain-containing protein [Chloroflexi bacterium]|nr:polymorphic toxin type 44 domain-containing protein [Chloroflexota bacterium]